MTYARGPALAWTNSGRGTETWGILGHLYSKGDAMSGLVRKSLDKPEETRPFEGGTGKLELVNLEGGTVGRATFQPGWKWSEHVKPIAKSGELPSSPRGLLHHRSHGRGDGRRRADGVRTR